VISARAYPISTQSKWCSRFLCLPRFLSKNRFTLFGKRSNARHLLVVSLFFPAVLFAQPTMTNYSAAVVHVGDGDSIRVTKGRLRVEVRLASIDAPELDQAMGQECKVALERRVLNRNVIVQPITIDRYGRTVANVTYANENINRYMVRNGCAWAYRAHLHDRQMVGIERLARAEKTGIWQLAARDRMPPWRYRNKRH